MNDFEFENLDDFDKSEIYFETEDEYETDYYDWVNNYEENE